MKLCQIGSQARNQMGQPSFIPITPYIFKNLFNFLVQQQITIIFLPKKSTGCGPANSQSGSLCTGSEISHFEIVESD